MVGRRTPEESLALGRALGEMSRVSQGNRGSFADRDEECAWIVRLIKQDRHNC